LALYYLTALLVLAVDQLTKHGVLFYVSQRGILPQEYITSGKNILDLSYAFNPGAAFSIFPYQQKMLIVITLAAISAIVFYLYNSKDRRLMIRLSLALITGGALGNLVDRIHYGVVIDFLDLHWREIYHWPTFNLADVAICVGVGLMILHTVRASFEIDEKTTGADENKNLDLNR